jgi:hypothetical protein
MVSITSAFCFSLFVLLKYPSFFAPLLSLTLLLEVLIYWVPPLYCHLSDSPLHIFKDFENIPERNINCRLHRTITSLPFSLFYRSDLLRNWLCSMKTTLCLCFKKLLFNYVLFVKRWMANEKAESPDSKVMVMFIKF